MDENLKFIKSALPKYIWRIASKKLENGDNLITLLNYNNISLWWYLDLPLYYTINNFYIDLNLNPSLVIKKNKLFHSFKLSTIIFFGLILLFTRIFFRYIYGKLTVGKSKNGECNILVPTSSLNWRESNYGTKKKKDQHIGDVIDELKDNKNFNVIVCDICEDFPGFGIKKLIEKMKADDVWRPLEFYLNFKIIKNVFFSWIKFIKRWRKFSAENRFDDLFELDEINIYPIIDDVFKKFFYYNLLNILLQIELLKNVIIQEKIKLTFTFCDHCVQGRSTIIAGNEKSIPTISLQTALMNPYGREYRYSTEEMREFPVPKIMALSGEYYKDLLIKNSSYPNDNLIVVGQPRYDFLYKEKYSKAQFCEKEGLDCNKKLILVTTQPFGIELHKNVNDRFLNAIFRLRKEITEEMVIIIKPHPREKADYYINFLGKNSIFHVLNEKYDIYDAINACDVLITFSSTTAIEAMIMKKPIIILNLTNEEITPYTENGAAILVKNEEYLFKTIKLALFDIKTREELFKRQKEFLYNFIYLQDGCSTKRFINLIKDVLNTNSYKY